MVESPSNLPNEQRKAISANASNTAKYTFENTPETLNVVCVDIPSNQLASVVVYIFVIKSMLFKYAVHFEAISVDRGVCGHLFFG